MIQPAPAVSTQYLSFFLAGQEYALGILQMKEIVRYSAETPLPGAPGWVRGVFNLRGHVVPVVDLAVKLGGAPSTPGRWSCFVVVERPSGQERGVVGLLVDAIGQVVELGPGEVQPPPSLGMGGHESCLLGLGRVGSKFVLLLDLERVLGREQVLPESLAFRLPAGQGDT
jgi:purine-binding chemotaxis protein CheW